MKSGWKTERLGDVCSFLNRGVSPKYIEQGGVCVLNQKCIRDHLVSYDQSRRHDLDAKSVGAERFIQLGDVLVNSTGTGTLGRVAQVRSVPPELTTVDSHVTIARPKPTKFFLDFFGYMLVLIEEAIKDSGEGCGGQTELARSVLAEKFSVSYPTSISEQQRIASILDEAFEGIATATANAERNLKNARALFQGYMQWVFTEKGEEWIQSSIGEQIRFIDYRGKTPTKTETGLRLITAKNVKMGFLQEEPMEFVAPESYDSWMTRGIPKQGDVLFTTEAPLANVAQLDTDEKVVFAQRIIIMQPNAAKLNNTFLKYLLLSQPVQQRINDKGTGATVKGIKASLLKTIEIDFPQSLARQAAIVKALDRLSDEVKNLEAIYQQKVTALAELKKSILHQAFTGQLH
jgi:type I restriction enzyme S subunit